MKYKYFALSGLLVLCACHENKRIGPDIVSYNSQNSIELSPDNSMLGTSCSGSDPTHSIKLLGNTYMNITFQISIIGPYGEHPWKTINAPASYDIQKLTKADFVSTGCAGHAIKTIIRRENGSTYLDWWMELAPKNGESQWITQGREKINTDTGTTHGKVAFTAFGKNMIVYVYGKPGEVYLKDWRHQRVLNFEKDHNFTGMTKGSSLPDEKPGRTLSDDIVQ